MGKRLLTVLIFLTYIDSGEDEEYKKSEGIG